MGGGCALRFLLYANDCARRSYIDATSFFGDVALRKV